MMLNYFWESKYNGLIGRNPCCGIWLLTYTDVVLLKCFIISDFWLDDKTVLVSEDPPLIAASLGCSREGGPSKLVREAFFLLLGNVWLISPWVRFPAEKKPDSWLVLLTSLSQMEADLRFLLLVAAVPDADRLAEPMLLRSKRTELKLLVKLKPLWRLLLLLLLPVEEGFAEVATLLNFVGLESSLELLPKER